MVQLVSLYFYFTNWISTSKFFKNFFIKIFCGFIENSLSTSSNVSRDKVAYIKISPDPAKVDPIPGGGSVIVLFCLSQ